jgi:hypothetical protein
MATLDGKGVSNQVATAIRDTLVSYLFLRTSTNTANYLDATPLPVSNYHFGSGRTEVQGSMAPAICIDDLGKTKQEGSLGGKALDGSTNPGFSEDEYRFDIEVWLAGRKGEDIRATLNQWRDGIEACLMDYWHLGDTDRRLSCETSSDDPAIQGPDEGSRTLWVAVVNVKVRAMVQQGSAVL